MRPELKAKILAGTKPSTNRAWAETTVASARKAMANGWVVRIQANHAFCTLWAWGKFGSISERRHPSIAIDDKALLDAGCGHMTKDEYIKTYCMVFPPEQKKKKHIEEREKDQDEKDDKDEEEDKGKKDKDGEKDYANEGGVRWYRERAFLSFVGQIRHPDPPDDVNRRGL